MKPTTPNDTPTPRQYKDVAGNPCSLDWLVKNEPEWAANQIRHRDTLECELEQMRKDFSKAEESRINNLNLYHRALAERDTARQQLAAKETECGELFLQLGGLQSAIAEELNLERTPLDDSDFRKAILPFKARNVQLREALEKVVQHSSESTTAST